MIGHILRAFFISPEFLISLAGLTLCWWRPTWLLAVSEQIAQRSDVLNYAWLLPAGLLGYDAKVARDILFPAADKETLLQGWQRYGELKSGIVVALVYGLIFAGAGIVAMLFDWKTPDAYQSATLISAVVGALTVSVTLYFAEIKVVELFREGLTQRGEE